MQINKYNDNTADGNIIMSQNKKKIWRQKKTANNIKTKDDDFVCVYWAKCVAAMKNVAH